MRASPTSVLSFYLWLAVWSGFLIFAGCRWWRGSWLFRAPALVLWIIAGALLLSAFFSSWWHGIPFD